MFMIVADVLCIALPKKFVGNSYDMNGSFVV